IASAGIHLLLALILVIGPGFISSRNKHDDIPILDFVPVKTVDELISGGGNPKAKAAAALPIPPPVQEPVAPPAPAPQPEPVKAREPDPPKPAEPVKPEEDSLETAKQPKKPKIEISKTLVTRKRESDSDKKAKQEAQAAAEAKAVADARRRLARQLGQAADHIGSELSGGTTVEDFKGPGGGGPSYANWRAAIKTIYENAWLLPEGVVDDDATTEATVTIARDGTVISFRITHLSGDSAVDRSVQAALDRVHQTRPLPDTAKEDQRTVTIKFSVRAKRALG